MMLTEEQAKLRWCPQSRSTGWGDAQVANRDNRGGWTEGECCIGSACMMWRWGGPTITPHTSDRPREGWHHVTAEEAQENGDGNTEYWCEPFDEAQKRRLGWCGLAGRIDHA